MRYSYQYITESELTPEVEWHFFKLRAIPCTNMFQQPTESRLEVAGLDAHGQTICCATRHSIDGLGNAIQWGSMSEPHRIFRFCSEGIVMQSRPYAIAGAPEPYYAAFTPLTMCSDEMKRFASQFCQPLQLMHAVHALLSYTPCHTTNTTTAAEVWSDRRGVCQDYAHLMIALSRANGWMARYVNGFIEGEGATHAWVEISDGTAWHAYDPTLDKPIEWGYVKLAHGRDASDCPTNRGRFYSWTVEYMKASVRLCNS